jgi:uncharacterized Zn-binding protein involved in type VI secretion
MTTAFAYMGCTVTDAAGVGIITATSTVTVNGLPIALAGDIVSPHSSGAISHPNEIVLGTLGTAAKILINGRPPAGLGEICSLGGVIGPAASPPTGIPPVFG